VMIDDRVTSVSFRIKQHLRYGSTWKQDRYVHNTTVSITNENDSLQTCVYSFYTLQGTNQLIQLKGKTTYRDTKGTFRCSSLECPSVRNGCGVSGRDKLSALAIAIS
ncbi:hypothetical protein EDC96DRAFT_420828, partial [Choanephora cucurbitarum]